MEKMRKLTLLLPFSFLTTTIYAQVNSTLPQPDEGMDIFLLVIGSIFVCSMVGAAIAGAFLATFTLLLLAALTSFGLLSTAIVIGLYKRSLLAGFKSFLVILFSLTCAFLGLTGLVIFNQFVPLHVSNLQLSVVGLVSGLLAGIFLGNATFKLLSIVLSKFAERFNLR